MKKLYLLAIGFTLLFTSCNYNTNLDVLKSLPIGSEISADDLKNMEVTYEGKIASIGENSILVYQTGNTDKINNSLSTVSTANAKLVSGKSLEELTLVDATAFKEGMTVTIGFNGMVQESYPTQIGADFIYLHDGEINNYIGIYADAIAELLEVNGGFINDINLQVALNLENELNMGETEKEAFAYVLGNKLQKEVFFSSYNKLVAEGRIIKEYPFFENGMILRIDSSVLKNDTFKFTIDRWYFGTGTGFRDTIVTRDGNGNLIYEIGGIYIAC